jgi:hypothetical protein
MTHTHTPSAILRETRIVPLLPLNPPSNLADPNVPIPAEASFTVARCTTCYELIYGYDVVLDDESIRDSLWRVLL